jgi:protein disulfide-isomerase A4
MTWILVLNTEYVSFLVELKSFSSFVIYSLFLRTETQLTRKQVLKVANEFKGQITFCISKEEEYEEELKDLKLEDSGEDVNVGYFESPKIRYAMEPTDDFDSSVLKSFINKVRTRQIKRTIKSQPAPARNEGPVTVVVGETFDSLVTQSDKNVLIEFYAQWCGHCKKLEPIYKQLAQKYSNNNNLVIAKIDATLNDYPELYDVSGFPTIYFLRRNDKMNPSLYLGDRSLEDLTKFVDSMLEHDTGKDEL